MDEELKMAMREQMLEQMLEAQQQADAFNEAMKMKEQEILEMRRVREEEMAQRIRQKRGKEPPGREEMRLIKAHTAEELTNMKNPRVWAVIALIATDQRDVLNQKAFISKEDESRMKDVIRRGPRELREEFLYYLREYDKLCRFAEEMKLDLSLVETNVALMKGLLIQWQCLDRMAEQATVLLQNASGNPEAAQQFTEWIQNTEFPWGKASLQTREDGPRGRGLYANIEGKGKLYERIKNVSKRMRTFMARFKADVVAVKEYAEERNLPYMPVSIMLCVKEAEKETFIRKHIGKAYLKSELEARRAQGEAISKWDEKMAVVPDYNKVGKNVDYYKMTKEHIGRIKI